MTNKHYILDKHKDVVETDLMGWATWLEQNREGRTVKQQDIGSLFVSTVFLGLDHNWSDKGPPIVFETMIFNRTGDKTTSDLDMSGEYQDRCSTYTQALEMHKEGVRYAKHYQTWHQKLKRWMLNLIK